MANLFSKASETKIEKEGKKKKKVEKPSVETTGIQALAAIGAVKTALESLEQLHRSDVKSQMIAHFINEGCTLGHRPENYRGKERNASASLELRKRSSASTLDPNQIAVLNQYGISFNTEKDSAETYVINPAYFNNQDLLEKVSQRLEGVEGLPEDFIQLQTPKERCVVSEDSLNEIFKRDPKTAEILLEIVFTLGIKPKLEIDDIRMAMSIVCSLLGNELKVEDYSSSPKSETEKVA